MTPILLVVDARPDVARARADALQAEAGDALDVRVATGAGEALDVARREGPRLAGVLAPDALFPGMGGLDLLDRVRQEAPQARRILVARELARAVEHPAFLRIHAAFDGATRFHDLADGIVLEALGSTRVLAARLA